MMCLWRYFGNLFYFHCSLRIIILLYTASNADIRHFTSTCHITQYKILKKCYNQIIYSTIQQFLLEFFSIEKYSFLPFSCVDFIISFFDIAVHVKIIKEYASIFIINLSQYLISKHKFNANLMQITYHFVARFIFLYWINWITGNSLRYLFLSTKTWCWMSFIVSWI